MTEQENREKSLELEISKLKNQLAKVETARKNENFWFQTIFDSIPNPIFVKNSKSCFHATNKAFEKLVDKTKNELIGKSDLDFFPEEEAREFMRVDAEVLSTGILNWNEEKLTVNDVRHDLLTSKVKVKDREGNKFLLGLITDITDKENQHIELLQKKDALENEKENVQVLLKEVHHRVKNNMQVVSSLLNLQMEKFTDQVVRNAFSNCRNRIAAMSNVHEILYKTANFSNINFSTYLTTLIEKLKASYSIKDQIEFNCNVINVFLNVDIAVPLGLAINEIVINSIKHGKIEGKVLKIEISLRKENGDFYLKIGDNGRGEMPEPNDSTFGLELVSLFCQQIDADLKLKESDEGVHYEFKFKNVKSKKR